MPQRSVFCICVFEERVPMDYHSDGSPPLDTKTTVSGIMTKPISTSSPAGLAAAQMVTPGKLSSLLLERGPLAIRHITQTLGAEIPSFKDLSSSKQRRLIMSAMESGDKDSQVVFAKIGWGQWSAKIVDAATFSEERDATNIANAKVKDIVSQESQRRRSSSSTVGARRPQLYNKSSSNNSAVKKPLASAVNSDVVYIDENAVASEDEDENDHIHGREDRRHRMTGVDDEEEDEAEEDDEEDDNDNDENEFLMNPIKREDLFSFRRRKSSVVFADSSPEDLEHELLAQRVRPLLKKNRNRRSSSKIRTSSISKNNTAATTTVHLDLPQTDVSNPITRKNSSSKIDLEQLSNSISEPTSRRESRMSFSKESSIRSTLLSHRNYHWLPAGSSPRLTYQKNSSQVPPLLTNQSQNKNTLIPENSITAKQSAKTKNSQSTHFSQSQISHAPHSDTDEEDWAAIGAAKLRNNSVAPKMETLATSPNGFVKPNVPDANNIPPLDNSLPPAALNDTTDTKNSSNSPNDDNNAAFLLMSLKS